jgi:hypothetical protein
MNEISSVRFTFTSIRGQVPPLDVMLGPGRPALQAADKLIYNRLGPGFPKSVLRVWLPAT